MTLPRLLPYLLLFACMTHVPSSSAQSEPGAVAARSYPTQLQQRIDQLLRRESEALDHYQQRVAPAIRCEHADNTIRQTCHDMLTKLRDEVQQAQREIARYRTSSALQPIALFDIYVDLHSLLEDIEILAVEDEFNGNRNHEALAEGYNSFIKLTGVWFTGEIRETMRNLAR
jgi:exonuclease VII large subunit